MGAEWGQAPAVTYLKTKVPPAPWPSTSLGLKETFPTTTRSGSASARERRQPSSSLQALDRYGEHLHFYSSGHFLSPTLNVAHAHPAADLASPPIPGGLQPSHLWASLCLLWVLASLDRSPHSLHPPSAAPGTGGSVLTIPLAGSFRQAGGLELCESSDALPWLSSSSLGSSGTPSLETWCGRSISCCCCRSCICCCSCCCCATCCRCSFWNTNHGNTQLHACSHTGALAAPLPAPPPLTVSSRTRIPPPSRAVPTAAISRSQVADSGYTSSCSPGVGSGWNCPSLRTAGSSGLLGARNCNTHPGLGDTTGTDCRALGFGASFLSYPMLGTHCPPQAAQALQ